MSRLSLTARVAAVILTLIAAAACSMPTGPSGKASKPAYDSTNPHI
jgi:hypothetical protein